MFKNFKVDNARRVEFTGNNIQIPKSKWAYLRNNIDTFHTTGGEGTPSAPIPIVNVSEWNKTVTGQNLFNKLQTDIVHSTHSLTQTANGIRVTATSDTSFLFAYDDYKHFLIAGQTYTFKCKWQNSAVRGGKTYFLINRSGKSDFEFGNTYWTNTNEKTTLYSFTPLESGYYRVVFYAYNHDNKGAMLEDDYCDFWDTQLLKGSYTAETMPAYQSYNGKSYPYRLEDTDGNLHYGGDLPDGTCDTVNWETGELVEHKKKKVLDGTESGWAEYHSVGVNQFYIPVSDLLHNASAITTKSSHFKGGTINGRVNNYNTVYTYSEGLAFNVATDIATDLTEWRAWLGSNPITVQYKLATPVTYQIKQYGETYGGVVWEYNEKPVQVEADTANVFSDKNVKMKFKAVSY